MRYWLFFLFILMGCDENRSADKLNLRSEPLYKEQWALSYYKPFYDAYQINPDAHVHGDIALQQYSGRGVKVAVIDTGINSDHFELKSNIIKVINARDGSSEIVCNIYDECSHGTAITGIIAADINQRGLRGFAPSTEIIFVNLDLNGYLADSEYIRAFELAAENGAQVIVCSWGTGDVSPVVKEKIDELAQTGRNGKGIVIIFAVANEGNESGNDESMLESVIGVGSSDEENLRSYYSSYGAGLDLLAPGGYELGITTTDYYGDDFVYAEGDDRFVGTSAAAPIVASLVALLLEANPSLTVKQIYSIITKSGDKIGNVGYIDARNDYYGYGKVDFDAAVAFMRNNF